MANDLESFLGPQLLVQKYGGATLSDPTKIKAVAKKICALRNKGHHLIVVVSAMGKTTNSLIDLANEVTSFPPRRELDMLLSAGERISMSLMSMALHDLGCPAISFTGSQAGLLTDEAHANAIIKDVRPPRVTEALKKGQVVVLAGFQGVSPLTKEVTTLGRGGSDTTAVAMAAYYQASRCEILKDVPAVFTADPNLVPEAKPLQVLSYQQLMDMTFWGAKVLHYRSVELASIQKVKLYIGPAHRDDSLGTVVQTEAPMFESIQILSLNTHESVREIAAPGLQPSDALEKLLTFFEANQIAGCQVLTCESDAKGSHMYVTGPREVVQNIENAVKNKTQIFSLVEKNHCTVTATCTGSTSTDLVGQILSRLSSEGIKPERAWLNSMSVSLLLPADKRAAALQVLHKMIT